MFVLLNLWEIGVGWVNMYVSLLRILILVNILI